ncbi:MAG: hypothetical protein KDK27_00465 [Leptospiraceae bacterium]|nr:hypothetical protein [Leptospiraceae bacterium]
MNYNLGRELERSLRAHIAECERCQQRLSILDEMQGQVSYGFAAPGLSMTTDEATIFPQRKSRSRKVK